MLKIALVWRFGASTSIFAQRIAEAAGNRKMDVVVDAFPEDKLKSIYKQYDIVLFGPQIQYRLESILKEMPEDFTNYMNIEPQVFGMMDGETALNKALEKIEKA